MEKKKGYGLKKKENICLFKNHSEDFHTRAPCQFEYEAY